MALSFRRPGYTRSSTSSDRNRRGTLRFLLILALIAWSVRSFVVAPFSIPSGSMLPALFIGDYVLTLKWPYGFSRYSFPFGFPPIGGRVLADLPERGDIVVFRHPEAGRDLIKRVIGLPGDTVELRGGMLVLNGRPLSREPRGAFPMPISANSPCKVVPPAAPFIVQVSSGANCLYPIYRETLPGGRSYLVIDQVENPLADSFGPVKVPAGHVFMLGDNRDDSKDSRFSLAEDGVGFVPIENLVGRASTIFWSTDGTAEYAKPWTWFTALRVDRIGQGFGNAE